MSSFPPYNPVPDDRVVWLLAAGSAADLDVDLAGAPAFAAVVAASHGLAGQVAQHAGGMPVEVIEDPAGVAPPQDSMLVVGPQPYVESVLRGLLGMPPESARFLILLDAVTVVQLLADRPVLLHLNRGRALDPAAG